MKYIATLNGKKYEIELEKVPDYQPLTREAAITPQNEPEPIRSEPVVASQPKVSSATSKNNVSRPKASNQSENTVLSPMPGNVLDVKVSKGQSVKAGQVLFILEAMKMENEIVSPIDGDVVSIMVKKGDVVESHVTLAILK